MLYRDWLTLSLNILWCHNRHVAEGRDDSGLVFKSSEYTNSGAWLVREGWAKVEHDGKCLTAYPGQWLLLRPCPRVQSFSSDARMLSIAFEARWPDGSHLYDEGLSLLLDSSEYPALESKTRPILRTMNSISADTWDARNHSAEFSQFLKLERMLCNWLDVYSKIVEGLGVEHTGNRDLDERVQRALKYLETHEISQPISLDFLSEKAGTSASHLVRMFRRDLKTTPARYWDRIRIEYACSRLGERDIRVKEVAAELGFKHLSHFSKWFKMHKGRSPRVFSTKGRGSTR